MVSLQDPWFSNITYFLTYSECPNGSTTKQRRDLRTKALKYVIHDDDLYKRAIDGTFLRCVDKEHQVNLLRSFHDEACRGHFSSTVTAFKILRQFYYWSGMFKDAYKWVANFEKFKMFIGKPQLVALPLRPVVIEAPFHQQGLDFIGPINPPSSQGHSYLLFAIDYFRKWVEAKPMKKTSTHVKCEFIKEHILVRI